MMPAFVRSWVQLLLICLVGEIVWLSCDACDLSISTNDREAHMRELNEIEARNWYEAEKLRWEMEESWHTRSPVQRHYKKYFVGKVIPRVGCDACPRECKVWDLRSMDPKRFEQRFRVMARAYLDSNNDVTKQLVNNELRRLGCVAANSQRLISVLQKLMSPEEAFIVRLEAATQLSLHDLDPKADEVFSEFFRSIDDDESMDAGVNDASAPAKYRPPAR